MNELKLISPGQYKKKLKSLDWSKVVMNASYVAAAAAAKSLQSCPTLCDPIDGSPLGSPITGILQARILEWVAISLAEAGPCQKRASSRFEAGTSGLLSISDSDSRVPAELVHFHCIIICTEIEGNNRMGKTRDLFKKIRDTKGTFHNS